MTCSTSMALTRQKKQELIDQYSVMLSSDKDIVLLEQRWLPVDAVVAFKKELATTEANSRVVKKRLLLQTAEKAGKESIDLGTLGWSLVAMELEAENYAPLKTILKLNKAFKKSGKEYKYSFLWGWYGKTWKTAEAINELASIPSKEELIGKFLYLLKYPMQATAGVLDQIAKKKESEAN